MVIRSADRTDPGARSAAALALADDIVARALASGATEAEALVTSEDAALTRFANSEIHQNVAEANIGVNLRFCVGRRVAVAATGRTDEAGLVALVERAAATARIRSRGVSASANACSGRTTPNARSIRTISSTRPRLSNPSSRSSRLSSVTGAPAKCG